MKKNFLIIGLGEYGKHLAYKLQSLGNQVCIVDTDKALIDVLAADFQNAYVANGMNRLNLEDLGVANYDACIVGVGNNYQASLEITSLLRELGARRIVSKATSDVHAKFLKMAGADETVYPESEMADKTAARLNSENLLDYIEVTDDYKIFEINIPDEWLGKDLKELKIRNKYNANVIAVVRAGKASLPTADYTFAEGDHVFLLATEQIIKKLQ